MKKLPDRELLCSFVYCLSALEPSGTCEAPLERPQGNWNVRSTIGTARRAIGTCEAPLELREAHNLSAEREVDADNRSCSASRDFLCVRVLVV